MAAARTEGFVYEMFLSNRVGQMVEQSLKHHEDARRPTRKPLNKLAQIFKFHTFQFLSTKNNSTCSTRVCTVWCESTRVSYPGTYERVRAIAHIHARCYQSTRRQTPPTTIMEYSCEYRPQAPNTTSTNHPTYFCKPFSLKLCTRVQWHDRMIDTSQTWLIVSLIDCCAKKKTQWNP